MTENIIVRVDWTDAASEEGTLPLSAAKELLPYRNSTVGFLLLKSDYHDNDDRIVLVQEICDPGDSGRPDLCRGATVIPMCCVTAITYLDKAVDTEKLPQEGT